jgi:outer membrane protein OmpA-like peptidoglycan-associated protein/tetratricopeptide (TPR) repeat protein
MIPQRKIFFTIVIILLTLGASIGQKPNREVKKLFLAGYGDMQYGSYTQALKYFEEIEKLGMSNANVQFNIGLCYLNLHGDKSRAIPYLERATNDISNNYKEGSYKEVQAPPEAMFYLGKAFRIDMQLNKAIAAYEKYKNTLESGDVYYHEYVKLQIKTCENAKEMIQNPRPIVRTNLGAVINNGDDNFNPVITPDGQTMVYTTLQRIFDRVNERETFYEIINYTSKENGEWQEPLDITSKINSDGYLATVGISSDGNEMYFFRDDYGDGNLYKAEKKGYRFTSVEELDNEINSRDWESHISPTANGEGYYFVSTRSGGKGGRDIYYIEKDRKGNWNDPVNLGRAINTPYDEDCPVISQDGKTLYFCSEAHNSMGGYDIFYSTKNALGEWTTPLNMGYPINSTDDDIFFVPYGDGKFALFSRRDSEDNFGGADIYQYQIKFDDDEEVPGVEVPNVAFLEEPTQTETSDIQESDVTEQAETDTTQTETTQLESTDPVQTESTEETTEQETITETPTETTPTEPATRHDKFDIRGIILLEDNNEITEYFKVDVANTETNKSQGRTTPSGNGQYSITVPPGNYEVTFSAPNYETVKRSVSIPKDFGLPKVTLDVELSPKAVASGEYELMRGVLFNYNSTSLTRDAKVTLEKLYSVMQQNPHLYVEVTGFSDPSGKEETTKIASKRVQSVVDYLVNKGLDESRFISKPKPNATPLVSAENTNPEAKKFNRRVEINIIKTGNTKITYQEFRVPETLKFGDSKGVVIQYTIQLVNSKTPLAPVDFAAVERQGISNIWIFPSTRGYLYTIGKYASRAEAAELLNKAVDMGFPNARIINFRELERMKHNGKVAAQKKLEQTKQKDGEYTIQLLALKIPVETSYFENIEGVERIKGTDGFYRYIWGRFDYNTALQKKQELKNRGQHNAFIMDYSFFEK